jgi:predicted enzyme related to lactoylglutathione lyase
MPSLLVNIDVDDLERARRFYTQAFDFRAARRLGPAVLELSGAEVLLYLLEKPAGSAPYAGAHARRQYGRHWSPIHLDLVVDDIEVAVERARAAGATLEQEAQQTPFGWQALLSDPFGNGFCLLQFTGRGYDEIAS